MRGKKMILDEIIARTKINLAKTKEKIPLKIIERALVDAYVPRDVCAALINKNALNIIAEIKKSSPSKGLIREQFYPLAIALDYERAGAAALSVLCESEYFQGNIEYMGLIRRYTTTPILRKDFIVDTYQIAQAVIYGADFILLIAKALNSRDLKRLYEFAKSLKLQVLVEIHDEEDLRKALEIDALIIGINHRNLDDFSVNLDLSEKLISQIPKGKIIVAESGLNSHEKLLELQNLGVNAFLIGEYFMRQKSVYDALKSIKGDK